MRTHLKLLPQEGNRRTVEILALMCWKLSVTKSTATEHYVAHVWRCHTVRAGQPKVLETGIKASQKKCCKYALI